MKNQNESNFQSQLQYSLIPNKINVKISMKHNISMIHYWILFLITIKKLIYIHITKDIKIIFFHFMNFYNIFGNKNRFANHLQLKFSSSILSLTSIKISIYIFLYFDISIFRYFSTFMLLHLQKECWNQI
jgi:hypothetical protein